MKNKRFNQFLLFAILLTNSLLGLCQGVVTTASIEGKITDEKGIPVVYATVSLLKSSDSTTVKGSLSTEEGTYTFSKISQGSYVISVSTMGYSKTYGKTFIIDSNKEIQLPEIKLGKPDAHQLATVNISSQKPFVERQVDKTVLNIANSAIATGNNALEILEKAPGVSVDKDGNISLLGKRGVTVMLDGKRTFLSVDQLANLLKSTEGNSIQSIELITNPSAKYDAAGNSGIINIVLKKNQMFGTNGSISLGGGYGSYYKSNAGITFNHREQQYNLFGSYNYSNNKGFENLDVFRENNEGTPTFFNQFSKTTRVSKNNNYKVGLDYFLDKKNTIGIGYSGYVNNGSQNTINNTYISGPSLKTDSSVIANNTGKNKYASGSYTLNYKTIIDSLGQNFGIDIDYSNFNNSVSNIYNNQFLDSTETVYKPSSIFTNFAPSKIKVWSLKADYAYPINKTTKLETGLKSSFVKTDNDFQFQNLIQNNFVNDETKSNYFIYKENINAAYINLHEELKTTTIQLGLRAEQTNSNGNSITEDKNVSRHYLNLFPSLFVNQVLSPSNEIGFSYSRRIDRPDYESLNPFIYYIDLYTFTQGNPFLNPQYTNSFELSYSFKKTLNISFGYSHTSNVITQVLVTDTIKKTLSETSQNLAKQDFYNLNLNYPLAITRWWRTNTSVVAYYNDFSSPNLLGSPYHSGKLALQLNSNQSFTINNSTSFELSGNYQSTQVYGTFLIKPTYAVDMGLSKSFANHKANIKIAANDIFNIRKTRLSSAIPSQNYSVTEKGESQVFRLTVNYLLGSNEVKSANQRMKGSSSEESRVHHGGN